MILWYFGVLCLKVAYCKYDAAFVHRSRLDVQIWNIVDYCIPSCSELRHELNRMCTFYCGISSSLLFLGKILQLLQYIFFLFPVFIRKIIRAATKGEIAIAKDEGGRSIGSEAESQSLCSSKSTPCSER